MQASSPQDPYRAMTRGGLLPALPVAAVAVVVCTVLAGGRGLAGALLATVVVVASFASSLIVMSRTARRAPHLVMAVALLTYTTKVGVLGIMLLALVASGATWLSGLSFGGTAVAVAIAWMVGEVIAFTRVRTLVFADQTSTTSMTES